MTPSEIIKDLENKGISRYKISKETKLSEKTLGNWLRKSHQPDPDKLVKLQRFYKKVTGKS